MASANAILTHTGPRVSKHPLYEAKHDLELERIKNDRELQQLQQVDNNEFNVFNINAIIVSSIMTMRYNKQMKGMRTLSVETGSLNRSFPAWKTRKKIWRKKKLLLFWSLNWMQLAMSWKWQQLQKQMPQRIKSRSREIRLFYFHFVRTYISCALWLFWHWWKRIKRIKAMLNLSVLVESTVLFLQTTGSHIITVHGSHNLCKSSQVLSLLNVSVVYIFQGVQIFVLFVHSSSHSSGSSSSVNPLIFIFQAQSGCWCSLEVLYKLSLRTLSILCCMTFGAYNTAFWNNAFI